MLLHFTIPLVLIDQSWAVCRPFIRLEDNLDETANLGFCPDVLGWGSTIRFDQALQVSHLDNLPCMTCIPAMHSIGKSTAE